MKGALLEKSFAARADYLDDPGSFGFQIYSLSESCIQIWFLLHFRGFLKL